MARVKALTPQETIFAEVLAETGSREFAGYKANYGSPIANGANVANRPHVAASVRALQEKRLNNELLPKALSLLEKVIDDPAEKTRDKITAAKIIVDRTIGMGRDMAADKAPEDMTAEELSARIAMLRVKQAEIAAEANTIDAKAIEPTPSGSVFD